jgi:arginyl-tRNA synthetase
VIPVLNQQIAGAVNAACQKLFGTLPPKLVLETPPKVELGDVALPVAFELARVLRRPPRKIAEELAGALELPEFVRERRVEGGGYINLFLDRPRTLALLVEPGPAREPRGPKTIIEHTNINPNKAAHIGHLRNAVLGDVLVRTLRHLGRPVEVQNYLDDTGVQVADVVVGLSHARQLVDSGRAVAWAREIEEILAVFPDDPPGVLPRRLGDLTWDLYALVGRTYSEDPALENERKRVLHIIESAALGRDLSPEDSRLAKLGARLAEAVVRCHLFTMARLGVEYDVLPRESDILARRFWERAFTLLKDANAVHLESEGKNSGCWVMRLEGASEFEGMEDADKILVRSNGTVTYTGKDVAYQLWKFGLLGTDFEYEPVPYVDFEGHPLFHASDGVSPLYRSRPDDTGADPSARGRFGKGESVINVIDVRQSYPQKVVKEAVKRAGFPTASERSIHFAYEMVALTPAAADEMGFELSDEDKKRAFVEMSGRKGLGVKADDLLDQLVEKAHDQIAARSAGEPIEPGRAEAIAIGALRVYMTRYSRNKVIAFDFDEALAFEGDTGPYLQYAAVRANNIFKKMSAQGMASRLSAEDRTALAKLPLELFDDSLWDVVRTCARTAETFEKVGESLEVSLLVRHALALAQAFHHLYHTHPILQAPDESTRLARRAGLQLVLETLEEILGVLGVPIPERM